MIELDPNMTIMGQQIGSLGIPKEALGMPQAGSIVFGPSSADLSPGYIHGQVFPNVPALLGPTAIEAPLANTQGGLKFDQGKARWSLLPPGVLAQVVDVITFGAKKYGPNNWQLVESDRYEDALHRHLDARKNGQINDPESGLHHYAHALCNLMFLLWQEQNQTQKALKTA
jgi:hypothetical protein